MSNFSIPANMTLSEEGRMKANQYVIYYQKGLEGEPEVFIDPNLLSKDGTVRINLADFSKDDRYVAYSRSEAGSDWRTIGVMEVATKKELDDKILVFRRPDGSLSALTMTCTHLGCDVDYDVKEDVIVCPCHGSRYDTFGRNLQGPADQPLTHFPVRIKDEYIIVEGISG